MQVTAKNRALVHTNSPKSANGVRERQPKMALRQGTERWHPLRHKYAKK